MNEENYSHELIMKVRPESIKDEDYIAGVTSIPRPCHDLFALVEYQDKKGILLIKRKQEPAKDLIWCLGGGQRRGYLLRESLVNRIKKECNLDIYDLTCLSGEPEDLFWDKDAFGHGKGVHDTCTPFFAIGKGELKLDINHKDPLIVDYKLFLDIKENLHWYIQKYTEKALNIAFGDLQSSKI
ncbi:MAG: hypothetical protein ACP5NZ_01580 [Nanobdellota archaeon]